MKRTKTQKGITLVALIITIVVLMILAGVAISSIQDNGILGYAQNAADSWNKAQKNETQILQDYSAHLNGLTSPSKIKAISISGQTLTVKATGGSANSGIVGYQYSKDGTTWSDTVAIDANYTFENLFVNGTNWNVYARSVDSAGVVSNNTELKIISFEFGSTTYYVEAGTTWGAFIENSFAGQQHNFSKSENSWMYFSEVLHRYNKDYSPNSVIYFESWDDWHSLSVSEYIIEGGYYEECSS